MWSFNYFIIFNICCIVSCLAVYQVPEPTFEAYNPKGLRVAIPDNSGVQSFSFNGNLNRPLRVFDKGDFFAHIIKPDNGYWIYWNSEVVVKPGDVLHYKIVVVKDGVDYRRDGGRYVFDKVITLPDTQPPPLPDCDEGQKQDTNFQASLEKDFNKLREMTFGAGQESSFGGGEHRKSYESSSSYSTQHSSASMKPIVRKTSSTVEGTYYIKPTGIEGTGTQTSSTYDSSKPDGYQWQHSRKDLTAEDLAKHPNLRELASLTNFNKGELTGTLTPSGRQEYHQSYYQKEVNSQHSTEPKPVQVQHSYFQQQQHQATPTQIKPQYYQSSYYKESSVQKNQNAAPVAQSHQGSYYQDTSVQKTVAPSQNLHQGSYYQDTSSQKTVAPLAPITQTHQSSYYKESTVQNQANRFVGATVRPDNDRRYEYEETYRGSVFDVRSGSGRTPTECRRQDVDVRNVSVERLAQELSEVKCLATLVETVLKGEINDLRRQYDDLVRRFQLIEQDTRSLQETCECIERNS